VICNGAAKLYVGAVARRIEIELTSARPDGTWTWRAAGALNPRGTLDGSLLYEAAKAGDVVRAEAEFGIEGITVVAVEPPRPTETTDPNRIELIERPTTAGVTTQLTGGRGRPGPDGGPDRRRGDQGGGQRRGRPSQRPTPTGAGGGSDQSDSNGNGRGARDGHGDSALGPHGARTDRPARPDRPTRQPRATAGPGRGGARTQGPGGREANGGPRADREGSARPDGDQGGQRRQPAPRQKRLSPGNAHRNAMLESLPAEQQPIAQQLLRGGIPAVRTALHFERERAREEGRPEPSTEGVLALAESLVSRVKAAEWRDRAEAAIKLGDDLAMRDLRSLVSGSDAARDEASRDLVVTLREMLERRIEAHRTAWSDDVTKNLDEQHVVRALRLSSRPPDPAARFSAELASRLRDAASTALSPATPEAQWLAVLQAVVESPVRRTVKPEGLPANPSPELLETARQHCGRVPALAPLLGISVPPPPGPVRPNVPTKAPSRGRARTGRPARRTAAVPAPPTRAEQPAQEPVPAEEPATAEGPATEPQAAVEPEPAAEAVTPLTVVEQAPEAPVPEVAAPEVPVSETEAPEPQAAVDPEPEAEAVTPPTVVEQAPEAAVPEAAVPEAAVPEAAVPEAAVPEAEAAAGPSPGPEEPLALDEGAPEGLPATEVTSGAGASLANEP
jgi:hypothetical protein